MFLRFTHAFCILGIFVHGYAADTDDIKGYAPVSVSSANYRTTERAALVRFIEGENVVNPPPASAAMTREPRHFVFVPGEIYESDLTYEELCALLTPALGERGFINAADAQGIIRAPDQVKLVLRVHYGVRPWRRPAVRTDQLTWRDGLEPRARGRGLHHLGGDRVWDNRAGGNDQALSSAAANQSNTNSFWGSGGGGSTTAGGSDTPTQQSSSGSAGSARSFSQYEGTREFHLIVLDAFDYEELKAQGKSAKRIWTTFVAAPKDADQPFSKIANTLIRNAAPFFGETSRGMQVYNDARAEVKVGTPEVVPEPQ